MKTPSTEIDQTSVRPRGAAPRAFLASLLDAVRSLLGGDRFENLLRAIAAEIGRLDDLRLVKIDLLDYGCGVMSFSQRLKADGIVQSYVGMDIFPPPAPAEGSADEKWLHYRQVPSGGIEDVTGSFDLTIVTDVLHHAAPEDRPKILESLSRISRYILVKDHFEYGSVSRQMLRLADWFGNYAYGVNVPDRYFNRESWEALVRQANLEEVRLTRGVCVHGGVFGLLLPPRHHFISVLRRPTELSVLA